MSEDIKGAITVEKSHTRQRNIPQTIYSNTVKTTPVLFHPWDTRRARISVLYYPNTPPHFKLNAGNGGDLACPKLMRAYADLIYHAAEEIERVIAEEMEKIEADRRRKEIENLSYEI